jgi:pyrimidine-nucleoside phosphorylase/thymidine phosphorylase
MRAVLASTIIERKRDSEELTADEIRFMIEGLVAGTVPDYQVSAWAMAVLCRGMTPSETAALTDVMLASGSRLERVGDRPRVDKHSTGGLGDKISLVLAPLLACFDVDVPMLSGRGLGITGGTLDKLEAYPGYRCDLSQAEINQQLKRIGCVITGTTPDIAPADRRLYALRDVTGAVPSIPLITASIMSKKLAATLDALVLDVKCGSGAFMCTMNSAEELAASLMATGARTGVQTRALISNMHQPLGIMVGNACEANEAVEVLRGGGPADVRELTIRLSAELLVAVGICPAMAVAEQLLAAALDDGRGLGRFQQMIESQGGRFAEHLPVAKRVAVLATQAGWVNAIDGKQLGRAVIEMGGGRRKQGDALNHHVGIEALVRLGDRVEAGQPLANLLTDQADVEALRHQVAAAYLIEETRLEPPPLVLRTV